MLSIKQGGIKYHFWVFGLTWPGNEPRSPGPLVSIISKVNLIAQLEFKLAYYYVTNQHDTYCAMPPSTFWTREGGDIFDW